MDQPDGYRCNCTEPGYEGTGGKACTEIDDCAGKSCGAGGTCVDGRLDYTCNCAPGFLSSSPHACTDIDECATTSLCTGTDYPCQNAAPFYACSGQFLATRMPDVTNPASQPSYTPQMDTVLDNVTHLLWQNNIPTTGSICGMGGLCTWEQARDVCDTLTLAGSSDWRLPSRVELESLLDLTRQGSAIAAPFQVATNPRPRFWTRSVYALSTKSRWYVDFLEGWSFYDPTPNTYYVRCVR
jgi:hypothetical protein